MHIASDILVIGGGIAGATFALEAARLGRRVIMLTKGCDEQANTAWAQGGMAAVLAEDDSFEAHIADTLEAGAGLCRRDVVECVVREGPGAFARLRDASVHFDRSPVRSENLDHADYDLTREGGHSHRRILHAGDTTGLEIMRGLNVAVKAEPLIRVMTQRSAIDLITTKKMAQLNVSASSTDDRCIGAYVLNEATGDVDAFLAPVTVLATGGASKVYLYTSNPDVATGDGVAMAWRIGAEVANMEFIQFHPTCLFHPQAKSFLISEALRGEGGILRRRDGTRFMVEVHPQAELAPRDIVARAIDTELKRTGDDYVVLDMTHLKPEFLRERFPKIYATCLSFGIDMVKTPIPVVPAAHYVCGGVRVDTDGRTTIPGLFAIGEVACSGMHGANRLASNSLLEAAVFGHRAAIASTQEAADPIEKTYHVPPWNTGDAVPSDELVVISQCWDEIRRLMWNYVGIVRSDRRLLRAQRRIEMLREEIREFYWNATVTRDLLELRNICTVAELIVTCALKRKESRGLHYTIDYPEPRRHDAPSDTIIKRRDLV
jgi:L-aspartate oxidase